MYSMKACELKVLLVSFLTSAPVGGECGNVSMENAYPVVYVGLTYCIYVTLSSV